jgi:PKD repeat protein
MNFLNRIITKKMLRFVILSLLVITFDLNIFSEPFILNKSQLKALSIPMMRLQISGMPNFLDETVVYYQSGATDGFDNQYDSYKLLGPNNAPHISQEYNSLLMAINGIEPVVQTFSINILVTAPVTANYTITAIDFANLPKGTCVYLHDLVTGTNVNILASPYTFNLSNTTSTPRFVLLITHYQISTVSNLTQPTCQLVNGGGFKIKGTNNGPWNYVWKDSVGTIIKSSLYSYNNDSLENLSNGNYSVEITSANNLCYYSDTTFFISPVILPAVSFIAVDTIFASITQNYFIVNQSTDCQNYYWNFGDGIGSSNDAQPTYNYSIPGLYKTKLIGISFSGCADSSEKYIHVIDLATSIINEIVQSIKLIDSGNNLFRIKSNMFFQDALFIDVFNLEGKLILKQVDVLNDNNEIVLDLNNKIAGVYVIQIGNKDGILTRSKIFIK